jgi:ATP-dependent helicase/nuclease subunit A
MLDARELPAEVGDGSVWRWQKSGLALADAGPSAGAPDAPVPGDVPDWLHRDLPPAAPSRRNVRPSAAALASYSRTLAGEADATRQDAGFGLLRGRLVHRLLQSLPAVAPEHRPAAARRFLAHSGESLAQAAVESMIAEVFGILDDGAFAPLFAPGSRAETPIVGRIIGTDGVPIPVSGQIDRLAVSADAVLIGDFKTDRVPPRRLQDVSPTYRRQLALYRAVLARLYPGRPVRAALIWTQTPELMEIPGSVLDADLAAHYEVSAA